MTTSFVICVGCNHIRKLADMARDGRCIYCRRPHLASPPLPAGFAIKPPADAVELQLRRMAQR